MAEQDRDDLVPSVLNDLIDVDGEPTDGDGLEYSTGAWRPTFGAGSLPRYGPVLNVWGGEYSGAALVDQDAINAAWVAMTVVKNTGYDYVGNPPAMGGWAAAFGQQRWRATEPGFYSIYVRSQGNADSYNANGFGRMAHHLSAIGNQTWGNDLMTPIKSATEQYAFTQQLTLPISQGMIDAGYGGFDVGSVIYVPGAGERLNYLRLMCVVERYSPGSEVDYFGDI